MRIHARADEGAFVVLNAFDDLPTGAEGAAHDVAVAAEVFCGGVAYNVNAVGKGMLVQGRCVGVVDDGADAVFPGDFGNGGKILHPEDETGRTFQTNERRLRADGAADLLGVTAVNIRVGNAEPVVKIPADERHRASVGRIDQDYMTARADEMQYRRVDGGNARGKNECSLCSLQRRNLALRDLNGGIGGAGIGVIGVFDAVCLGRLDKQRVLVNGRDNCALKACIIVAEMRTDVLGGFIGFIVFG